MNQLCTKNYYSFMQVNVTELNEPRAEQHILSVLEVRHIFGLHNVKSHMWLQTETYSRK